MYDIEGSDDKNWVEIYNDSASEINLKDWRFNDGGSNHILMNRPPMAGRSSLVLSAFGYAILASDATTPYNNQLPSPYSGIVSRHE